MRMHRDEIEVDAALVQRLLAAQMPHLSDRPLTVVEPWGTDNAIWRLGDDLVVRLPRIQWASGQTDHDASWLPRLAPYLPIEIPEQVAIGEPGEGYPYRWAVHRWIAGDGATPDRIGDPVGFALELADVIRKLQAVPTAGAPAASNRARPLADYDRETRAYIGICQRLDRLRGRDRGVGRSPRGGPPLRSSCVGAGRSGGQLRGSRWSAVWHCRLGISMCWRPSG
jgi:aminoglycoside phosphotransferase (APT) family kinase protein